MKLISYLNDEEIDQLAILVNGKAYDTNALDPNLPGNMGDFLFEGPVVMKKAKEWDAKIKAGEVTQDKGHDVEKLDLLAPVPFPTSCRDAYAFRQHVAAARRNRGVDMIPEFDQFPIFYFTNHNAVGGPGEVEVYPDHLHKLDFELEVAAVIGRDGRDIKAEDADSYIAGYTIMNDWSARLMQMEEMKLNLGPAKGKDFATSIGPWLVTPDELEQYLTTPYDDHTGTAYNLEMKCWVNDELVSEGNMNTMFWTFAEIIERVSYGVDIFPGDVIGSGTVGTGCFLELNGTARLENPSAEPLWLKTGDRVTMEITGLGRLENTLVAAENQISVLEKKKSAETV